MGSGKRVGLDWTGLDSRCYGIAFGYQAVEFTDVCMCVCMYVCMCMCMCICKGGGVVAEVRERCMCMGGV